MSNKWVFALGFLAAMFLTCFAGMFIALFGNSLRRVSSSSADSLAGNSAPSPSPVMMAPEAKEAAPSRDEGKMGKKERRQTSPASFGGLLGAGPGGGGSADSLGMGGLVTKGHGTARAPAKSSPAGEEEADKSVGGEGGASAGVATRAWFPETFLFEPLILTDAKGHATVPVKVPDRLTSWRVLALAHSRQGGQAGAVTSFLGTLPSYVDPVIPGFLMAGDEVRLPVQLVNTTTADLSTTLKLSSENGSLSAFGGAVKVPAEGNNV